MNWLNTIIYPGAGLCGGFLEGSFDLFRNWLGAQITLLPALMVYASLTSGIGTVALLAVCGGLWRDSLSADPLGVSILPLFLIGFIILWKRDLLLRENQFAQMALGLAAGAVFPLAYAFFAVEPGAGAAAGLDVALAMGGRDADGRDFGAAAVRAVWPAAAGAGVSGDEAIQFPRGPGNKEGTAVTCLYLTYLRRRRAGCGRSAVVMAGGMLALLAGLWFVQIVSGKQLQGRHGEPVLPQAARGGGAGQHL